MDSLTEPQRWHNGSVKDRPRNDFVIPEIVRVFSSQGITSATFVGSATGYIPSCVCEKVSLETCVLIEPDRLRLQYSKDVDIKSANVVYCDKKFEENEERPITEATVMSNTLLEFELTDSFCLAMRDSMHAGGKLLLFAPDVLEDVVQSYVGGNRTALIEYIEGCHSGTKTDKFNMEECNFIANRELVVLEKFLRAGFVAKEIILSDTLPKYIFLHLEAHD